MYVCMYVCMFRVCMFCVYVISHLLYHYDQNKGFWQ